MLKSNSMKKIIIALIVIIIAGIGIYFFFRGSTPRDEQNTSTNTQPTENNAPADEEPKNEGETVIGSSVEGNDITAYHYGEGDTELLFVGGIHGGYSWNTALVAYETMDYLEENPDVIPDNVRVTVIPVLNPDGLEKVVGTTGLFDVSAVPAEQSETIPGRFNANDVDLNRNFDCDWQADATWQNRAVSGGSEAFSEPESQAIKNYVEKNDPKAVVVWYSSAGGVFASSCHSGVLPETLALTKTFAEASGYSAYESFNFYETTGDMVNWLAKNKIPAISVLLTNHTSVEWTKNQAGIDAVLNYYAESN